MENPVPKEVSDVVARWFSQSTEERSWHIQGPALMFCHETMGFRVRLDEKKSLFLLTEDSLSIVEPCLTDQISLTTVPARVLSDWLSLRQLIWGAETVTSFNSTTVAITWKVINHMKRLRVPMPVRLQDAIVHHGELGEMPSGDKELAATVVALKDHFSSLQKFRYLCTLHDTQNYTFKGSAIAIPRTERSNRTHYLFTSDTDAIEMKLISAEDHSPISVYKFDERIIGLY